MRDAQPDARRQRGGGDTLALWRWQGKASRIKALTMKGGGCPGLGACRPGHDDPTTRIRSSRHLESPEFGGERLTSRFEVWRNRLAYFFIC